MPLSAQELLKMEYEVAAVRYDNIYKALWQNFSYLAVVSGAILAFGAKLDSHSGTNASAELGTWGLISCVPLIFWYWGSFEPLNKYGDITGRRLAEIERLLNETIAKKGSNELENPPTEFKLQHFTQHHGRASEPRQGVNPLALVIVSALSGVLSWLTLKHMVLELSLVGVGNVVPTIVLSFLLMASSGFCIAPMIQAIIKAVSRMVNKSESQGKPDNEKSTHWWVPTIRVRHSVRLFAALLHLAAYLGWASSLR